MKTPIRYLIALGFAAGLALTTVHGAVDTPPGAKKKVLFFSKSSGFEHDAIKTDDKPGHGFAFTVLKELGEKNHIDFTFSKDGSLFTPGYLAQFDSLMFYTTGDLTEAGTDKNPPMTAEGKTGFLKAIENGKGFVGIHSAADTFHSPTYLQGGAKAWESDGANADPYIKMIGGEFIKHDAQQRAHQIVADPKFPGLAAVGADFGPNEEWYSLKNFARDLHVLLVQETKDMAGPSYQRPPYPATWARMHGKGRVFYTNMGHRDDVWTNPVFQSVLMGGLNWSLGRAKADVASNLAKVAPQGSVLPKYVEPPPKKQTKAEAKKADASK